jgi:protein TonB
MNLTTKINVPRLCQLLGCVHLGVALLASMAANPIQAQTSPSPSSSANYDTPPVLIHKEPARFTRGALSEQRSGTVTVQLTVDLRGFPTRTHVLHGVGEDLDESAIETVRRYRYKPALKDGKPVEATIDQDIVLDPTMKPGP